MISDLLNSTVRADWQIWTAAIMTDTTARDLFITAESKWTADGLNSAPLSDWYDTLSGQDQGFSARPVVGGHLGRCYSSASVRKFL